MKLRTNHIDELSRNPDATMAEWQDVLYSLGNKRKEVEAEIVRLREACKEVALDDSFGDRARELTSRISGLQMQLGSVHEYELLASQKIAARRELVNSDEYKGKWAEAEMHLKMREDALKMLDPLIEQVADLILKAERCGRIAIGVSPKNNRSMNFASLMNGAEIKRAVLAKLVVLCGAVHQVPELHGVFGANIDRGCGRPLCDLFSGEHEKLMHHKEIDNSQTAAAA